MKLKELEENIVVDIKSEKELHVLQKLLEDAGYQPFKYSKNLNDTKGFPVVCIKQEDKTSFSVYGFRPMSKYVLLEDIVELEARDFAVIENGRVVACYTYVYGGSKLGYIYKPDVGEPWGIFSDFPLDAFIEYYAGKYNFILNRLMIWLRLIMKSLRIALFITEKTYSLQFVWKNVRNLSRQSARNSEENQTKTTLQKKWQTF